MKAILTRFYNYLKPYAFQAHGSHEFQLAPPHLVRHQVNLVEQDAVRERNLLHGFVDGAVGLLLLEVEADVLGVGEAEDGVDAKRIGDLGVDEKGESRGVEPSTSTSTSTSAVHSRSRVHVEKKKGRLA